MMKKRPLKIAAFLTGVLFSFTSVSWSAPPVFLFHSSDGHGLAGAQPGDSKAFFASLPGELGRLERSFVPSNANIQNQLPAFVVHIQDAHANVEAQNRIRDILFWIRHSGENGAPVPLVVALEGSAGRIHPEYLDIFPEFPKATQAFVEDLQKKGELSGAEIFAWENYVHGREAKEEGMPELHLFGAETPEVYRENLFLFRTMLLAKEEIQTRLRPYKAMLDIALSRVLNPELRNFLRESERSEILPASLLNLIQKHLQIDLFDRIEQIRFPNLTRFLHLRNLEPYLEPDLAKMEWTQVQRKLYGAEGAADAAEIGQFLFGDLASSVSYRKSLEELLGLAADKEVTLQDFPHFMQWMTYRLLSQEVDSRDFMSELARLKNAMIEKLAVKEEEKKLIELYRNYGTLENLLSLELTRSEYEGLISRLEAMRPSFLSARLREILKNEQGLEKIYADEKQNESSASEYFEKALKFYEGAERRDHALFSNALEFYSAVRREGDGPAGKGPAPVLVLISGGFHSPGITDALKDAGVAHFVISPRISKLEKESLYHKVLRRENADVSSYFLPSPLNKQEALFLKGLIETASPELARLYEVKPEEIPQWVHKVLERHPVLKGRLESLYFSGKEEPFVRVNVRSSEKEPGAEARAVGEVSLLTSAGSYGRLSHEDDLTAQDPAAFGSFTVRAQPNSGHPRIERQPVESGTIVSKVLGGLNVTSGNLDAGTAALLKSARAQFEGLARSGILGQQATGFAPRPGTGLIVRPGQRSELRQEESPKPAIGEIALDRIRPNQEQINEIVEKNSIIYVTASVSDELSYDQYRESFNRYVEMIGYALKALREKEAAADQPRTHKVFIFKTWTDVGSTEKFFDDIKWFRAPPAEEGGYDFYMDAVFQPDFSYRDSAGNLIEDEVVFGLRNYEKEAGGDQERLKYENGRKERTLALLESAYRDTFGDRLSFVSVRSAEQAKDDLILYLAAKLTHFNDLALLAESYGADLSVVTYGTGLDKRIRPLFTNPSLGFGGKLAQLLDWIYEARLNRAWETLESTSFFTEDEKKQPADVKKRKINDTVVRAYQQIEQMAQGDGEVNIEKVLLELPAGLHYLFLLETIRRINRQNLTSFEEKIEDVMGDMDKKSAAIIGVGHREGDPDITKSPAKRIIRKLVLAGVRNFYIVDPSARESLRKWLDEISRNDGDVEARKIKENRVQFHGLDKPLTVYEAAAAADFSVITTSSVGQLRSLDLGQLKQSLGDKPLFDGINLFGLRANGTKVYAIDDLRAAGIHYYSVGRMELPGREGDYKLQDSYIIGEGFRKGDADSENELIADYQARLLALETDDVRRGNLARLFQGQASKDPEALAAGPVRKNVAVIGGGYVGLTTGANLADLGHQVSVLDIPQKTREMEALNSPATAVPIHEPGLRDLIIKNKDAGRITFTADEAAYDKAVRNASILYLAVGTPQQDNGAQDPSYIYSAVRKIAGIILSQRADESPEAAYKTIVIKSTVTQQVFEDIVDFLERESGLKVGRDYGLVSNPEFLREGQAIKDITTDLDRTVLGFYSTMNETDRARVEKDILELWYPLAVRTPHPVLITDTATSTLIKYAANAFLAVSITIANVLAEISIQLRAAFHEVAVLLRRDRRIGENAFLACGPGYGGSCFPKDVRALNYLSNSRTLHPLKMIVFADEMNQYFKIASIEALIRGLRGNRPLSPNAVLQNKAIAVWGLAFKPDTDDMRETPSAHLVAELLRHGANTNLQLRLDDPIFRTPDAPAKEVVISRFVDELYKHFKQDADFRKAYESSKQPNAGLFFGQYFKENFLDKGKVVFTDKADDALFLNGRTADALIIVTDWSEYRRDLSGFENKIVVDTRDMLRMQARLLAEGRGIQIIAPGRAESVPLPPIRSELRSEEELFRASLAVLSAGSLNTREFAASFKTLEIPGMQDFKTLEDLVEAYPAFGAKRKLIEDVSAYFYDSRSLEEEVSLLPAWRFIQLLLAGRAEAPAEVPYALQAAREALGPYAWLLDALDYPAKIMTHLPQDDSRDQIIRVSGILASASSNLSFPLIMEGSALEARSLVFAKLRELKLPVDDLMDQFLITTVSGSPQSVVRAMKQLWSEDPRTVYAALESDPAVLEGLGYIPRMTRISHEKLSRSSAVLITAALLKQLSDQYDIVRIEDVLDRFDIQLDDLVDRVARMIEVLNHIATQA